MRKNNISIRILAITGTVLLFLPVLTTILTGTFISIARHRLRVDYLMPAELGLLAIIGGGLLLLAAIISRTHFKQILLIYLLMIIMLVGSQAIAVWTGLASGAREATGWPFTLVIGMLVVYALLMVVLGLAGVQLSKDLIKAKNLTE